MTLLQIEYFLAVTEYGSFGKAAERLYVSQPAVSKRISSLEEELGCQLFDGDNRNMVLTDEGKMFRDCFRQVMCEINECKTAVAARNQRSSSVIRLLCSASWNTGLFFPRMKKAFEAACPGSALVLAGNSKGTIFDEIISGGADVALNISHPIEDVSKVCLEPFVSIPVTLLFSSTHPLCSKEHLSIADFKNETFYIPEHPSKDCPPDSMQTLTLNICRKYGFEPKLCDLVDHQDVLFNIQNNLGVTFYSGWYRRPEEHIYRTITEPDACEVKFMYPISKPHPLLPELIRTSREEFSYSRV